MIFPAVQMTKTNLNKAKAMAGNVRVKLANPETDISSQNSFQHRDLGYKCKRKLYYTHKNILFVRTEFLECFMYGSH